MSNPNQEEIYENLSKLQEMAQKLPSSIQQRLSNELLSSLASALVEGNQIFEIVEMLTQVQNAFEKKLFHQRIEVQAKLRDKKRDLDQKCETLLCQTESRLEFLQLSSQLDKEKQELMSSQKTEQKNFDSNLVLQLDQKVLDQQVTLEKAGVPGFFVTNNPTDIQLQMCLLDFIKQLKAIKSSTSS